MSNYKDLREIPKKLSVDIVADMKALGKQLDQAIKSQNRSWVNKYNKLEKERDFYKHEYLKLKHEKELNNASNN